MVCSFPTAIAHWRFGAIGWTPHPVHSVSCWNVIFVPYFKSLLPSANEVCEGYVFTTVCQSFCSQGGSTWAVTPGRYTLRAGTLPGQVHPLPPGRYNPPPREQCMLGEYWQQAGGTHPTGIHFCLQLQTVGIEPIGCFV